MHGEPTVVVKKAGFLSATATGFFTFLTATVVCASGLGAYGMWIASEKLDQAVAFTDKVFAVLPEWQRVLPPAVKDMVNDQRDPAYREKLDVAVRLVPGNGGRGVCRAVVEVTNRGDEAVSLLGIRVVAEDASAVPVGQEVAYVATPAALDGKDMPGPLMPGSKRKLLVALAGAVEQASVSAEIVELRVWRPAAAELTAPAAEADSRL
jgi:hypothetical protein